LDKNGIVYLWPVSIMLCGGWTVSWWGMFSTSVVRASFLSPVNSCWCCCCCALLGRLVTGNAGVDTLRSRVTSNWYLSASVITAAHGKQLHTAVTSNKRIMHSTNSSTLPCHLLIIIIIIIYHTTFMVLSSWLRAIARVHPVLLMNADWAPGDRQHSDLGCESTNNNWQLPSTSTITIYYYYSAWKLICILPPHGW